jgi:predicted hydrocarbon binding protein
MIVTRHISLDNDCIEKMKPYIEKHKGNFSAAIREIIDRAGNYKLHMNSQMVDNSLFKWLLTETDDVLISDNVLDELIDPILICSMKNLEEYVTRKFSDLEWGVNVSIQSDNDTLPSEVLIEIKGSYQKIKFAARILSQYMVKNSPEHTPLEIKSVNNFGDCITVELSKSNKSDAQKSITTFFGGMNDVTKAIKGSPSFWKTIINGHVLSNYNMVTIHRNYFEDLLANKIPLGEITIETLAKKPIQEIPLKEMLPLIKEVYEASKIVDRVEIDKENIILFHNYRNNDVIDKLKRSLVTLLEASGHLYDAKSTNNIIVLNHRPDVGIKINEIVSNLKISNSSVDQDLIMFMAFLKGLKNIPDIPLSLTLLGRRIGKSLMQEYEKENDIKNWGLLDFKKVLEVIDLRIHRESEWKLEGNALLYKINKCDIVSEGNTFDTYICHAIRETFKGALEYAFGDNATLEINKLLSHGDDSCEIVIRTQ